MTSETRTGFAAQPGETAQIRRFPIVAGWDAAEPDDQVLVRHAGKNFVYSSPAELAATIRAANAAEDAARRLQAQAEPPRREAAGSIRIGFLIGFLLAPVIALIFMAVFG